MSEKKIAIHFGPKSNPEKHDGILVRAYGGLIEAIEKRGYEAIVTRGADHYDFETGMVGEHWTPERDAEGMFHTKRMGEVAVAGIGSVRDFGKKLRPSREHPLALLNTPEVIEYDHSKYAAFRDILQGLQGETHLFDEDSVANFNGELFVVKPDKGWGGEGVYFVSRDEPNDLMNHLMKTLPNTLHVVQEYVDMTRPFPPDIKGMDAEETAMLEKLKDRKKELRVFGSYGENGMQMVPVARMMKEGEETASTWIFVDPDYIPSEVADSALLAFSRLSEKTNSKEIFGAVDFMWGSTASEPEPSWRVGEMNTWKPLVYRRKPEVGRRVDSAMADQLVRMAERSNV